MSTKTPVIYDFDAIGETGKPTEIESERVLTGDDEITNLFLRWIVERRAASKLVDDEERWEAQLDRADAIEVKILLTPASGAAGLAIKFYLGFQVENSGPDNTIARHNTPGELCALRDAVRFAPVLEPLCRDYLAEETRPLGH